MMAIGAAIIGVLLSMNPAAAQTWPALPGTELVKALPPNLPDDIWGWGDQRSITSAWNSGCYHPSATRSTCWAAGMPTAPPGARSVPVRPRATARLDGACLEAYMMKPSFLYPTATALRPLFERARFVLPNGGPGGFVDVACGRIDVYLAWQEALTEVFSAVAIAERAGCVVTHWDGSPLAFRPDIHALHSLVCSANRRLHDDVLRALRGITPPKGPTS